MPEGARIPRFPRIVECFGEPIDPARYVDGSKKERIQAMTDDVMAAILELRTAAREEA
jgi:hypothetical protein